MVRRTYILSILLLIVVAAGFLTGHEGESLQVFNVRRNVHEISLERELVPLGMTIGVRINTDGVMVLGTGTVHGADGKTYNPSEGILHAGDLILKVNNIPVKNKENLSEYFSQNRIFSN